MLSSTNGSPSFVAPRASLQAPPLSQGCGAIHANHVPTNGLHFRVHAPGLDSELKSESEGNPFLLRTPISGPWAVSKKCGKIELAATADDSRVS